MAEAGAWGFAAACSLVLGAVIVLWRAPASNLLGLVMGYGAGVLIGAVAFELVDESIAAAGGEGGTAAGLAAGAVVFFLGDTAIARLAGSSALDGSRTEGSDALPIVLGTVLDGVPESAVLGLTLLQSGEIGVSMLVAVFVSNLPEAVAATTDLIADGWSRGRVLALWTAVAVVSGLAAAGGYAGLDQASSWTLAFTFAFAAGAILAMLSTSMVPEAYERAGRYVGLTVTAGFTTSFAVESLTG